MLHEPPWASLTKASHRRRRYCGGVRPASPETVTDAALEEAMLSLVPVAPGFEPRVLEIGTDPTDRCLGSRASRPDRRSLVSLSQSTKSPAGARTEHAANGQLVPAAGRSRPVGQRAGVRPGVLMAADGRFRVGRQQADQFLVGCRSMSWPASAIDSRWKRSIWSARCVGGHRCGAARPVRAGRQQRGFRLSIPVSSDGATAEPLWEDVPANVRRVPSAWVVQGQGRRQPQPGRAGLEQRYVLGRRPISGTVRLLHHLTSVNHRTDGDRQRSKHCSARG
jgi:hypothetical protein